MLLGTVSLTPFDAVRVFHSLPMRYNRLDMRHVARCDRNDTDDPP